MPIALAFAPHGKQLRFPWFRRLIALTSVRSRHPRARGPGDEFRTTVPLDDPGEAGLNARELHYYRMLRQFIPAPHPSRPQ